MNNNKEKTSRNSEHKYNKHASGTQYHQEHSSHIPDYVDREIEQDVIIQTNQE